MFDIFAIIVLLWLYNKLACTNLYPFSFSHLSQSVSVVLISTIIPGARAFMFVITWCASFRRVAWGHSLPQFAAASGSTQQNTNVFKVANLNIRANLFHVSETAQQQKTTYAKYFGSSKANGSSMYYSESWFIYVFKVLLLNITI